MKLSLYLLGLLLALGLSLPVVPVQALEEPQVIISEVQTGSSLSANEEFIELYNQGLTPVDLSSWKVEYYPSSATSYGSPFRTISLSGVVSPGEHYLLASTDYLADAADLPFSQMMAASGGTLRLVRVDVVLGSVAKDILGWGSASLAEGTKASAPGAGKSLVRKPLSEGWQDTDNNLADFEVSTTPTPTSGPSADVPEPPEAGPPAAPEEIPPTSPPVEPAPPEQSPPDQIPPPVIEPQQPQQSIILTELLPNPASPATDDSDEFIELYNPGDGAMSLDGYVVKTGNNLSYQQKLDGLVITAKSYLVLYSRDTDLVLSNTAGKAVLFGPEGQVVSGSDNYESAPEGQSWVYLSGTWQWSSTPTPNTANILAVPILKATTTSNALKKATAKKSSSSSTKAATTKKAAASAAKPKKANNAAVQSASTITEGRPLHPAVLGLAGVTAVLYGLYEYRADIRNHIRKFRRYRSSSS